MFELTRDNAWHLLTEYTRGESLRKHALAVEAAVRGYARKFGEDEETWGVVALLHDFDYEQYPELTDHPFRGAEILRARGCPEFIIRAILSHGEHTNTPPQALALLNAEETFEAAAALAKGLGGAPGGDDERIALAYRLLYARRPAPAEVAAARDFLSGSSWSEFCRALFNSSEFIHVD